MALRDRHLAWDGCLNVRDLGGHRTADDRETRFGAIVRADSVRRLSDEGWQTLVEYGVSRIVDLRLRSELREDPPLELPVEVVHLSLMPELDSEHWPEVDAIGAAAGDDYIAATRDVYLEFLERLRENFARAIGEVARAPEGAVVIHCAGGKDRTGLVVALLLRLAGVSIADIGADYAVSERNLREATQKWIAAAEDEEERLRRRRVGVAPAEAMVAVLEELERRHGSAREYLLSGGASDDDLDRARARLVE